MSHPSSATDACLSERERQAKHCLQSFFARAGEGRWGAAAGYADLLRPCLAAHPDLVKATLGRWWKEPAENLFAEIERGFERFFGEQTIAENQADQDAFEKVLAALMEEPQLREWARESQCARDGVPLNPWGRKREILWRAELIQPWSDPRAQEALFQCAARAASRWVGDPDAIGVLKSIEPTQTMSRERQKKILSEWIGSPEEWRTESVGASPHMAEILQTGAKKSLDRLTRIEWLNPVDFDDGLAVIIDRSEKEIQAKRAATLGALAAQALLAATGADAREHPQWAAWGESLNEIRAGLAANKASDVSQAMWGRAAQLWLSIEEQGALHQIARAAKGAEAPGESQNAAFAGAPGEAASADGIAAKEKERASGLERKRL